MGNKQKKPQIPQDQLPLEIRLKIKAYRAGECDAAIHGQRVPPGLAMEVTRLCVIRGIRHHYGFAQELRGAAPEFTRALNARDIMSGFIPTITDAEEIPYCIWHPDVPSEDTLRTLVQRYPNMVYHAARACAVAGYFDLYKELDLLPEVHVAEEASYAGVERKNQGSEAIYQSIVSQPVKFAVMNDYTRTINIDASPCVASLNGNTAVYSSLAARQKHRQPTSYRETHNTSHYFNITEDWGIDDHDNEAPEPPMSYFPLLYSPLPVDLPPVNKDKMILVAAYHGDIDRYTRLRRPQMIRYEFDFVIRGIYHNPFWAKWWSSKVPENPLERDRESRKDGRIRRAINARRIMSDDITWITPATPGYLLPANIWYPARACPETYENLARIRPDMLKSCLRACIAADYQGMWDRLLLMSPDEPTTGQQLDSSDDENRDTLKLWRLSEVVTPAMWLEARFSHNNRYQQDIAAAVPASKLEALKHGTRDYCNPLDYLSAGELYHPISEKFKSVCKDDPVQLSFREGSAYDGIEARLLDVEFTVFAWDTGLSKKIWEEREKRGSSSFISIEEMYEALEADGSFG